MERRAYLLGAGFSKAISEAMPLLSELSHKVKLALRDRGHDWAITDAVGDNFEHWLSYLASDQPWLNRSECLRNRADFLDVSRVLGETLEASEQDALEESMPHWLRRLAGEWLRSESGILTFNYDNLVERAIWDTAREASPGGQGSWIYLYEAPLNSPPIQGGLSFGHQRPNVPWPSLFKLHGSIGWFHAGHSAGPHDALYLRSSYGGWQRSTAAAGNVRDAAANRMTDKVPFIVPPTAVKNDYYTNAGMRAQWQAAASELRRADELVVLGYSFPMTDLVINSLVATTFGGSRVTVVDRSKEVAQRLRSSLKVSVVDDYSEASKPIEAWVERTIAPNSPALGDGEDGAPAPPAAGAAAEPQP